MSHPPDASTWMVTCQKPASPCSMVTPTALQLCTQDRPRGSPSHLWSSRSRPCAVSVGFRDILSFLPTETSFPSVPVQQLVSWRNWIPPVTGRFLTAWVLDASPGGFPLHSAQRAAAGGSCTGCCSHLATSVLALHWPEAMQWHLCTGMMSRIIRVEKTILNDQFLKSLESPKNHEWLNESWTKCREESKAELKPWAVFLLVSLSRINSSN